MKSNEKLISKLAALEAKFKNVDFVSGTGPGCVECKGYCTHPS